MKLDPVHIVILGLLIFILIVVAKISHSQKESRHSFSSLRTNLRDRMPSGSSLRQLREGYDDHIPPHDVEVYKKLVSELPAGSFRDLIQKQAEQQAFALQYNYPPTTIFAELGEMAETCQTNNSPQCQYFNKYLDGINKFRRDRAAFHHQM